MATAYVSVGSNVEPEQHIRRGLALLREYYGDLKLSPVYRTRAVGFEGEDFLNLALSFETRDDVQQVADRLDDIENQCGRVRSEARFGPRTLDLDLLLFDDLVIDRPRLKLPRDEILKYAFVLRPLSELAPDLAMPTANASLASLWAAHRATDTPLIPVAIDLQA